MVMFNLFRRRKRGYTTLTDEDRELGIEARKLKADERRVSHEIRMLELQLQKLEREADIQELKEQLYGDDEEEDFSPENILKMILTRGTGVLSPHAPPQEKRSFTEEQIKELIARSPAALLKHAKTMHPDDIKAYIRMQLPDIEDNSLEKAVSILKA